MDAHFVAIQSAAGARSAFHSSLQSAQRAIFHSSLQSAQRAMFHSSLQSAQRAIFHSSLQSVQRDHSILLAAGLFSYITSLGSAACTRNTHSPNAHTAHQNQAAAVSMTWDDTGPRPLCVRASNGAAMGARTVVACVQWHKDRDSKTSAFAS